MMPPPTREVLVDCGPSNKNRLAYGLAALLKLVGQSKIFCADLTEVGLAGRAQDTPVNEFCELGQDLVLGHHVRRLEQ